LAGAAMMPAAALAEDAPGNNVAVTATAGDRGQAPAKGASDYISFDSGLLMGGNAGAVDLSRFTASDAVEPRTYNVDIYVNGDFIARQDVRFERVDGRVGYCVDSKALARFQVNMKAVSPEGRAALSRADAGQCSFLPTILPGSSALFDLNELRLDIAIPQAAMLVTPRGYVAPEAWDAGVTAATLSYRANFYHVGGAVGSDSGYVGLTAGLNLDGWYFRHQSATTLGSDGRNQYQNIATYVQRHLPALQAKLTLGDSFTDGMVFDTIGVRGIQLASEDQMLPESQRGYAPLVRGSARTNARVTVTQNGVTLYEATVAPGPFVIRDLYATGYGANLEVTVTEADGSVNRFSVPYAAAPQLVRKGRLRYSLAGGWLRDQQLRDEPPVLLGAAQYGLSNLFTVYGGATLSEGYGSALVGGAINTSIGSFSADVTLSNARLPEEGTQTGHRVRLSYAAFIEPTDTNVAVAAYVHNSRNFLDLRQAAYRRQRIYEPFDLDGLDVGLERERNRYQATINQNLGDAGRFFLSGTLTDYWTRDGRTFTAQVGYGNSFRIGNHSFNFNIDYSRVRDLATGASDDRLFASISMPLGSGLGQPIVTASAMEGGRGTSSQQLRVNGTTLENYNLAYGAYVERQDGNARIGGNIDHRARPATFSASASAGGGADQFSVGLSGGIVIHPGGVTLANDLGDTIGIVEAKGASGAKVLNGTGIELDDRGYAIIPYLSPYRLNDVAVDPQGVPLDVQFRNTAQKVAPVADAAVMVRFATTSGRSALITIRRPDGSPAPFGATLVDEAGEEKGVVGQQGQAFGAGLEDTGTLYLSTGDGVELLCGFNYHLPESKETGYSTIEAQCGPIPSGRRIAGRGAPQQGEQGGRR